MKVLGFTDLSSSLDKKWSLESLVLAVICVIDLLVTLWMIQNGSATEGNPILNYYLEISLGAFILAKLLLSIGPITILEALRARHPRSIRLLLRLCIVLYLLIYSAGSLHLNAWQ